MFFAAATFLVLSGIASLSYQVIWVRLLGLSMGSTSASISTVLAAFFLGMAAGSYLAERMTRNRIDNLKTYIVLEVLIGISGLALLPILLHLDNIMAWLPAFGSSLGLKFLLAVVLLSLPTACMGATFPVMASILIRHQRDVGLRMSQLYSLNTAGAVLGAGLSGFVFIPAWGLDGAVYAAVAINVLIIIFAYYVNSRFTLPPVEVISPAVEPHAIAETPVLPGVRLRAVTVLFVTGFVAIATQVGWSKYLAIFTGTTIYGFAAILTVFLLGIAAGAWAIRRQLEKITDTQWWMAAGLVLLAASLFITRGGLTLVPNVYGAINHLHFADTFIHGTKYLIVFFLLIAPTFIFGALFPLNLKMYCGGLSGVRTRVGKAYAINTLASIFGAIAAGFWIIPQFGTDVLLTGMGFLTLAAALLFLPAFPRASTRVGLAFLMTCALFVHWIMPHLSYRDLIASVQYRYDAEAMMGNTPEFLFLKEGKAGVISAVTYDGVVAKLQNNGLNESIINMKDPDHTLLVETLLGLIPYMLHPNPQSAFVVGLGGGTTTRALTLTDIESIKVVELEPAIVDAGLALTGGDMPAITDKRVQLEFNDARNTLLVEKTKYDIIAAQPSHPWLARASNVFTQQFWQIASSRLTEDGVFGQWVNLFNMDSETLKSIFKAFCNVFPHAISFANLDTGDYILFGSNKPIQFKLDRVKRVLERPPVRDTLAYHEIATPMDLFWYAGLSRAELIEASKDAEPNTDTNILSEVRLSRLVELPQGELNPYSFLRSNFRFQIAGYVDKPDIEFYNELAQFFLQWNDIHQATRLQKELAKIDPREGRALEYEIYWHQYFYKEAFALHQAHEDWPARTHRLQALAKAKLGQTQEAWDTIAKIKNETERAAASAHLLFELGEWAQLATRAARSTDEQVWQLTAAARSDLRASGEKLAALLDEKKAALPQLRVLAGYYSLIGDYHAMDRIATRMGKKINTQIEYLAKVADEAFDDDNFDVIKTVLLDIQALDPENIHVRRLVKRMARKGKGAGEETDTAKHKKSCETPPCSPLAVHNKI